MNNDDQPSRSPPALPPGAMAPTPRIENPRDDSPPATPSHRLLGSEEPQYATYREKSASWTNTAVKLTDESGIVTKPWIPYPLRPWFWIPFVLLMILGAIGLEVALHFSNKNSGWATNDAFSSQTGVLHYVYTLPPVAVAAVIVALWTWTDIEIKKMQPYVDLVHGDSPPKRSLLLDYTRTNNFFVWSRAAANKHYLVALASLMVLLSLTFQPLAAALLVVRDTWWGLPDTTVNTLAAIGLNQNQNFDDLTSFLTAAGFASASVLYNLGNSPFVFDGYTVAPFQLPNDVPVNSTMIYANTTALRSDPGCQAVSVNMAQNTDGSGWNNSVSSNGCSISFAIDRNATNLFGTDIPTCDSDVPPQFSPVIFWFFTYEPQAAASAALCFPSITLWDVNVNLDLASGNITQVTELRPFSSSSNFSSLSANVTGPPLNGRAYNGIEFNLTNPDRFVLARKNATQLQMPAAVFQAAVQSPEGLIGSFQANTFARLSSNVYRTYLTLIAKTVYFLDNSEPITIQMKTVQKRIWLSDVAVHLLAVAMFLLAFFATIIQLFHRYDRRSLRLLHEPGTIASAVSIGAQTGMGDLLAGRQHPKDISAALQDKKFRIDPKTMKIVMEGEDGYEFAASPGIMDRRRSIFAALQSQRISRRFSSKTPISPTTPKEPLP
ncbi:uncharacterized protein EV420DRAFT_1212338 [Desarmillaria tabescens]|uniref:Uncharacterized protein n=1 Tax=Armillaria tabescens TaxID=1929756 RepID=A0AA39J8Z7_ARMTA|nr:uncharacterized protein EV420DRAFT_1212338 [Desarmillaria tabescens]KAK0438352.1 hypothetical protein EV420DRAFT_1212338 [Desarmillaria tabescens]